MESVDEAQTQAQVEAAISSHSASPPTAQPAECDETAASPPYQKPEPHIPWKIPTSQEMMLELSQGSTSAMFTTLREKMGKPPASTISVPERYQEPFKLINN